MIAYSKMKGSEPIKLLDTYPVLYEKSSGTPFDPHYFYQHVWAFKKNSISSLSCLNVAEHIGLGKYGDKLDPYGTKKACGELAKILAPGGNLYFSGSVGYERVCFNAHRVNSPKKIVEYFKDLELVELSAIDDQNKFVENIDIEILENSSFACGLFHFIKK